MKNSSLKKAKVGKLKKVTPEFTNDTTGTVDMIIDNETDKLDYLQSLAIEQELVVPIHTFVKLKMYYSRPLH